MVGFLKRKIFFSLNFFSVIFFAITSAFFTFQSDAATRWNLPTGYNANSFQTQNVEYFAREVERLSEGELVINVHPGGALFKQQEIKRAVQAGLVPIGETILSGLANENPLFGIDSIPFVATGYVQAAGLLDAAKEYQQSQMARQGLQILTYVPWPGQGLWSNKPISKPKDIKNSKMRVYNPASTRLAELVGAIPLTIQLTELPQALSTGTVDNVFTSSVAGLEMKIFENTRYFYPFDAWHPHDVILVNQRAFMRLPENAQQALINAAELAQERGWNKSQQESALAMNHLSEEGIQIVEPSAEILELFLHSGKQMVEEWQKDVGDDGFNILQLYQEILANQ
jgi:TRAP-type C4-dicarboxylate transport system substrate-binding protein